MKKTSLINKLRGAVAAVFMLTFCPGIYAQSLEYVQPFSLNRIDFKTITKIFAIVIAVT